LTRREQESGNETKVERDGTSATTNKRHIQQLNPPKKKKKKKTKTKTQKKKKKKKKKRKDEAERKQGPKLHDGCFWVAGGVTSHD
jgi:hypothetical protein